MGRRTGTYAERLWERINTQGPVPEWDPSLGRCWIWRRQPNVGGYGVFYHDKVQRYAHRASYELFVGPIPEGHQLDHLCRVRNCVNPAHLEPVTNRENTMRSPLHWLPRQVATTHCPHGHLYDEPNTYYNAKGHRFCRTCNRERARARLLRTPAP